MVGRTEGIVACAGSYDEIIVEISIGSCFKLNNKSPGFDLVYIQSEKHSDDLIRHDY